VRAEDDTATAPGDDWERLAALFEDAGARLPAARDAWLRDACRDARDRAEIEALLAAAARGRGPVDRVMEAITPVPLPGVDHAMRTRVGPYELLRELGRGGMGVVYLARRADGLYQRLVALKLAHTPVVGPSLQAFFLAERDILAGLTHPHIAPLFDGGVTDDGLPYFTMEYVDGQTIDAYCDEHALDLAARVRLFRAVCGAVAAAHRSLVVHLDLKPTNVLVTADGTVKLLDFGIAKLLGPDGAGSDIAAGGGGRLMTPAYSSPEQATGAPVSTATDVYGLGLVLYELLCGRRAHRLPAASATDLERAGPPPDPPAMAEALVQPDTTGAAPTADAIARARRTSPARLARQLRGDLAHVTAKALSRDPDQRYTTAAQMADDLERWLEARPVVARGSSSLYRARRFALRHRLWLGMAAIALAALVGVSVMTALRARDTRLAAEREHLDAARAREVADFLVGLFEASDPDVLQNHRTSAAQLLDQGLQRANALSAQPPLQARVLDAIGRAYFNLGRYTEAAAIATRTLAINRTAAGARVTADVGRSHRLLGLAQGMLGKPADAVASFRAAIAIHQALGAGRSAEAASDRHNLGYALVQAGRLDEGERDIVEALAQQRALLPAGHADIAMSLSGLAYVRGRQGRPRDAVDLYREALAMRVAQLGDRHPEVARGRQNLAAALSAAGIFDEAGRELRHALEIYRAVYGEKHPSIATTINNLGTLESRRKRDPDAIRYFEAALAMRRDLLGAAHPATLLAQNNLVTLLTRTGRMREAEQMARDAVARSTDDADSPMPRSTLLATLGRTLMLMGGRDADARQVLEEALTLRRARMPATHPDVARLQGHLDELAQRRRAPASARR
jgi:eukaryotic-like serine/threonine-protein kinase